MLGILGGSGFYSFGKKIENEDVFTPYGTAEVQRAKLGTEDILFIPRHGKGHTIPPHKINYRANLYALRKLGATALFATYASGIISRYQPSDLVLLEGFIGLFTPITVFDDFRGGMKHFDFSEPFSKPLQTTLLAIAKAEKIKIQRGGVIITTPGPRFETKAEIQALKKLGANLVNMTSAYEITLARELELPFAAIAVATNYAAGIRKTRLSMEEVLVAMDRSRLQIHALVQALSEELEMGS